MCFKTFYGFFSDGKSWIFFVYFEQKFCFSTIISYFFKLVTSAVKKYTETKKILFLKNPFFSPK